MSDNNGITNMLMSFNKLRTLININTNTARTRYLNGWSKPFFVFFIILPKKIKTTVYIKIIRKLNPILK